MFGVHINIKDLILSHKLGIKHFQIFTKSPMRSGKIKMQKDTINNTKTYIKDNELYIVIHGQYILNLCRPNETQPWAINSLIEDLNFLDTLDIKDSGVVLHLGKNTIKETNDICHNNFINSLIKVCNETTENNFIILETSCKIGNDLYSQVEDLSFLYHKIPDKYKPRIRFCIDTCHIFVSGYDIRTSEGWNAYLDLFDKHIGLDKVVLIHLNDSKSELGSGKDRHEELTKGFIFKDNIDTLKEILQFGIDNQIPLISETPHSLNDLNLIKGFGF